MAQLYTEGAQRMISGPSKFAGQAFLTGLVGRTRLQGGFVAGTTELTSGLAYRLRNLTGIEP